MRSLRLLATVLALLFSACAARAEYWSVLLQATTVELPAANPAAEPKFDAVLRLERPGQKPVLYFVLTRTEKALEKQLAAVGEHLDLALKAVEAAKDPDVGIVFFLRHGPQSAAGSHTGFTREQLRKIAALPADQRAAKLLEHHWAGGTLPNDAKPVGEKPSPPAPARPAPDLSQFPKLQGKVKGVLGVNLNSFIPPEVGDPFHLELKEAAQITKLDFDAKRMSYIPLPGPVAVESIHYYSNGAFSSMRLVSKKGRHSVTIDIRGAPGLGGPNRIKVWVVVQSEVVEGVALIEGEYEGAFPNRPK